MKKAKDQEVPNQSGSSDEPDRGKLPFMERTRIKKIQIKSGLSDESDRWKRSFQRE
jgi:hypothetical protein